MVHPERVVFYVFSLCIRSHNIYIIALLEFVKEDKGFTSLMETDRQRFIGRWMKTTETGDVDDDRGRER